MITERPKLSKILISPVIPKSEFELKDALKSSDNLEAIRRGYIPNFFLLNEYISSQKQLELSIIDFRKIFLTDIIRIRDEAKKQNPRLRLRSPFREAFSQALGKFFMRVGIPDKEVISRFTKKVKIKRLNEED